MFQNEQLEVDRFPIMLDRILSEFPKVCSVILPHLWAVYLLKVTDHLEGHSDKNHR